MAIWQPPRLRHLQSASIRSNSKRDSEFTKMTPGPGIGKYIITTENKWSQAKNINFR